MHEDLYRGIAAHQNRAHSPLLIISALALAEAIARALTDYTSIVQQPLDRSVARLAVGNGMRTITGIMVDAPDIEAQSVFPG